MRLERTSNPSSKVCGSGLDCGRVSMGGIAMVSVAQNHYEPYKALRVSSPAQQLEQLGDIGRNPSHLIAR